MSNYPIQQNPFPEDLDPSRTGGYPPSYRDQMEWACINISQFEEAFIRVSAYLEGWQRQGNRLEPHAKEKLCHSLFSKSICKAGAYCCFIHSIVFKYVKELLFDRNPYKMVPCKSHHLSDKGTLNCPRFHRDELGVLALFNDEGEFTRLQFIPFRGTPSFIQLGDKRICLTQNYERYMEHLRQIELQERNAQRQSLNHLALPFIPSPSTTAEDLSSASPSDDSLATRSSEDEEEEKPPQMPSLISPPSFPLLFSVGNCSSQWHTSLLLEIAPPGDPIEPSTHDLPLQQF